MIGLPERPEVQSKATAESTDPKSTITGEFERTDQANQNGVDEKLYLIGRPTLKEYIRYVAGHVIDRPGDGTLAEEWQAAATVVRALEKDEAGLADNPPLGKMGEEYEPLLIEFLKDPLVRYGFNTVPTEVAMVELDRLVVYQKHIDLTFVPLLESKLGPAPSRDEIFRTCLPYDHPQPPVKWSRVHHGHWVFVSPSNDLRFLGPMPIDSSHLKDHRRKGNLVGVVGIAVGFGSNFLNAIYAENRLILNNGSHRAYTLRKMGITHAPCIVQHVSSRDELSLVAPSEVRRHPDRFLKHPRPMMLKDYFNPLLYKVMKAHRRLHQVIVRFDVEENFVPAL